MSKRTIEHTGEKTLGEFIANRFSGYAVTGGACPLDKDITHGVEITVHNCKPTPYTTAVIVELYPCEPWTDGTYRPVHYWGSEHYITLERKGVTE